MRRAFGRGAVVGALCLAVGLHLILAQTFAWTTMLVENARHAPLRQALAQTFDGAHPCDLCKLVGAAEHSQKKSSTTASWIVKVDLYCPAVSVVFQPAHVPFFYARLSACASLRGHTPPVPPPRCAFG